MPAQEIKLPLMCQARHIRALPAQAEGVRYAVCWGGGIREPRDGMGYLMELTGKRTGRVVGWLQDGGYVYACDAYLEAVPAAEPRISLARWRNKTASGCISLRAGDGDDARQVSEFRVRDDGLYAFDDPVTDLGPHYSGARVDFRELLAVAFLAFWYLPHLHGTELVAGRTMADVLAALTDLPPADAVDMLVGEVRSGGRTSGFERYAARVLTDADPAAFRALAAGRELSLRRLGSTGLFWVACDLSGISEGEFRSLTAMEGALNRLALIARRARENGADALSASSEEHCADEDWRCLRSITDQTAPLLKSSVHTENGLLSLFGTSARRGGEWDLRTRIAYLLEHLALPYRLVYRFAVDAGRGSVVIAAGVPDPSAMPRWVRRPASDGAGGGLVDCSDRAPVASSAYALRLVAALTAVAFSANAGVGHVSVRLCRDRALTRPVLLAETDREGFIMSLYDAVRRGAFSETRLTWGVSGLRELLGCTDLTLSLDEQLGLTVLETAGGELFDPDVDRTLPVWRDGRALTGELAALLHADRVCELDVYHLGDDPFAGRLRDALDLASSRPAEAAQTLSDLLGVMSVMDDAGGDAEAAAPRALYCSSGVARLAMALVDDDPQVRYRYVFDSHYDVYLALARLCTDNDDAGHGAEYARRAIELGPTSPRAYVVAATAEADLGNLEQAAELLRRALLFDIEPASFTYTYYRLAFVLWKAGDALAGLACYQRARPNPRLREAVDEEMAALMAEISRDAPLGPEEVVGELERAHVPASPTDAVLELAARAMILAADAGYINVARAYGRVLVDSVRSDAFMGALASMAPWSGED